MEKGSGRASANKEDQDPEVRRLQAFLQKLSIDIGTTAPDGDYWDKTVAAVKTFQEGTYSSAGPLTQGAYTEGKFDTKTLEKANAVLATKDVNFCKDMRSCTPTGTTTPGYCGYTSNVAADAGVDNVKCYNTAPNAQKCYKLS